MCIYQDLHYHFIGFWVETNCNPKVLWAKWRDTTINFHRHAFFEFGVKRKFQQDAALSRTQATVFREPNASVGGSTVACWETWHYSLAGCVMSPKGNDCNELQHPQKGDGKTIHDKWISSGGESNAVHTTDEKIKL